MTHKFLPVSSQIPMKMWMCLPPGPLPPPPPQLRGTIPWRTSNAAAAVSLGLPENRGWLKSQHDLGDFWCKFTKSTMVSLTQKVNLFLWI